MTHTPGPWEIFNCPHDGITVIDEAGDPVCDLYIVTDTGKDAISRYERDEENARLIASAPDLLKWLEVANDMLEQAGSVCDYTLGACKNMTAIREAIAKAKGESI